MDAEASNPKDCHSHYLPGMHLFVLVQSKRKARSFSECCSKIRSSICGLCIVCSGSICCCCLLRRYTENVCSGKKQCYPVFAGSCKAVMARSCSRSSCQRHPLRYFGLISASSVWEHAVGNASPDQAAVRVAVCGSVFCWICDCNAGNCIYFEHESYSRQIVY